MFRLVNLGIFIVCAPYAWHYAAGIKNPLKQKKRVWTTFVFGLLALTALFYALGAFIHSFGYLLVTQLAFGVSLMLVAAIPCGLEFFNRKGIRALRNLFFLALGGYYLWMSIGWLHQGWAPL
jgi:hypothetical protein